MSARGEALVTHLASLAEFDNLSLANASEPIPSLVFVRASGSGRDHRELTSVSERVPPGGAVVVEYPTVATAGRLRPLGEFAKMSTASIHDADERVEILQHLLAHLLELQAHALVRDPVVRAAAERAVAEPGAAAELLAPTPLPVSFDAVDRSMRDRGFTYVSGLRPGDLWAGGLEPDAAAFIAVAPSPGLCEHLRDLALSDTGRLDLFVRGALPLTADATREALGEVELTGLRRADSRLDAGLAAVVDGLEGCVASVRDLLGDGPGVESVVRRLLAGGYVHPAVAEDERDIVAERAARLEVAARRLGHEHGMPELANVRINPLAGAVVPSGGVDAVE